MTQDRTTFREFVEANHKCGYGSLPWDELVLDENEKEYWRMLTEYYRAFPDGERGLPDGRLTEETQQCA